MLAALNVAKRANALLNSTAHCWREVWRVESWAGSGDNGTVTGYAHFGEVNGDPSHTATYSYHALNRAGDGGQDGA